MKLHYLICILIMSSPILLFGNLKKELEKFSESLNNLVTHFTYSLNQKQKNDIVQEIQNDILTMYVYKLGIIKKDIASLSQGNKQLENDLTQLYESFKKSIPSAQQKLNEFTQKWNLEPINIEDITQKYHGEY